MPIMDDLNDQPKLENETIDSTFNEPATDQAPIDFTKKSAKKTKLPKHLFAVLVILIILFAGFILIKNASKNQSSASNTSTLGAEDQRVNVQKPKSTQELNRQFSFPLKGADGNEVSQIKYEIQNVELRNEIIVKGQKATAVQGRTFLILNLKITNNYDKSIQINARDYVRLVVNNAPDKLAPDIHNDPVEIQAISTKYTRLGFPINDTDKNLVLQIGEISGPKESITLNLK